MMNVKKFYRDRSRRDEFHRLAATIMSRPIGPCVALDCEMVGVGPEGLDSALARVSIVDWEGDVIIDTYVHVPEPVTDYRTYVSGVTARDLESYRAITLEDCRYLVQTILNGRVLVGHALVNDLSALMLTHPWYDTRDTANYVPFQQVCIADNAKHGRELRARKLSDLVKEKLGRSIQQMGKAHSSVEDARAALDLYKAVRTEWETLVSWKVKKAERESQPVTPPRVDYHHQVPRNLDLCGEMRSYSPTKSFDSTGTRSFDFSSHSMSFEYSPANSPTNSFEGRTERDSARYSPPAPKRSYGSSGRVHPQRLHGRASPPGGVRRNNQGFERQSQPPPRQVPRGRYHHMNSSPM